MIKEKVDSLRSQGKKTWSTQELIKDFEVIGFLSPFVLVKRKADGQKGTLQFNHSPRVYFSFVAA